MIFAEKLTKKFDEFTAVKEINLDVASGEALVLLGPNGAGKTTTVRMLNSILIPTSGKARIAGYDVITEAANVRASVGVLTEHHGLYGRMNAIDYLLFFADLYNLPRDKSKTRINELLEIFTLIDVKKQRLGEYSKGMRQKLALVRALLPEPPVLLLDEPTSAMDPESAKMVRDAIHTLKGADRTIMLCTHNLTEAELLADKIAIIWHGQIIQFDTVAALKRNMLGPEEFKATCSGLNDCAAFPLPAGVKMIKKEDHVVHFQIDNPTEANPELIRNMVNAGINIISFHKVHRSLENAYLAAVHQATKQV
ncbi:MAG: ABC transporter ATP-binding protein [Anaerolineaceae bacterium]|nr:ABC transporter ATP-binding protein [Anaerolineaceae bacterium]